jgi:hypothetical protein
MAHYSRGLSFPTYLGHQSITPVSYTKINIEQDPQKSSGLKYWVIENPRGLRPGVSIQLWFLREERILRPLLIHADKMNMAKHLISNKYQRLRPKENPAN